MMTRKGKILWICYAAALVLLFLLSSTDLIIKERKTEIYPLSVIIDGIGDEYYINFRKGMDRAAIELNADVRYISLYEEDDQHQQLEMIAREQQDGARALIMTPPKDGSIDRTLTGQNVTVPLVLVNSGQDFDKVSAVVTTDYDKMGQTLAMQVLRRHPDKLPVRLFSGELKSEATWRFEEGIRQVLSEAGYEVMLFSKQGEETFQGAIEGLADSEQGGVLVIALDQESLTETAALLADDSVDGSAVKGLYGRGTTVPILNYLDRGVITGICVSDDFSAGYLSVKRAVEAVTDRSTEKKTIMESYYIEKEDLRKAEYEKMLYPIE